MSNLLQSVPASEPARQEDHPLSHIEWTYVDKALTDLANKFERAGNRAAAHDVRVLCAKFFDGFETVIRGIT